MTATVAQAVAQTLAAYGTKHYFCLTGGDHDLWLALDEAGIGIVNCRSEAAATYMADGYARVSGAPGFVYGQRGPGAANVAAALADAFWALSPVVSLTTSIALPTRDRFQYQEVDTLPMHAPVTVWNKSLSSPERAGDMVRAAIRAATGLVPGPVHLEIPADLLAKPSTSTTAFRDEGVGSVGSVRTAPDEERVSQLVDRLLSATRPLILCGNGTIISGAWDEVEQLSTRLGIPVATTLGGKGSIDERSPRAVGVVGRYSRRVANEVVGDCDTVLALGTRLGGLATSGWQLPFSDKKIIQVDADPNVLGHNYRTELSVLGDVRQTLRRVLSELEGRDAPRGWQAWSGQVAERVSVWQEHASRLTEERPDDGMHPASVVHHLRAIMTDEDLLVADTGAIGAWAGTLFPVAAGRTFLRSAGSLGWALPGALGAALADPSRRTVCLVGDGGLMYHLGELETAMRLDIPIVVVVLNNMAFASEYHLLKYLWKRELPAVTDFNDVDLAAVAAGFGAHGLRVDAPSELADTFDEAFARRGPVLIDARISREAVAPAAPFRGDSPV